MSGHVGGWMCGKVDWWSVWDGCVWDGRVGRLMGGCVGG